MGSLIAGVQETSADVIGAVGSALALLGNPLSADDAHVLAAETVQIVAHL